VFIALEGIVSGRRDRECQCLRPAHIKRQSERGGADGAANGEVATTPALATETLQRLDSWH
jgi:hypothetical protein